MPEHPEFLVESDCLQMLNAETLKKWRRRVVTVERDYLVRQARECDAFSGMDSTILVEASPCTIPAPTTMAAAVTPSRSLAQ